MLTSCLFLINSSAIDAAVSKKQAMESASIVNGVRPSSNLSFARPIGIKRRRPRCCFLLGVQVIDDYSLKDAWFICCCPVFSTPSENKVYASQAGNLFCLKSYEPNTDENDKNFVAGWDSGSRPFILWVVLAQV